MLRAMPNPSLLPSLADLLPGFSHLTFLPPEKLRFRMDYNERRRALGDFGD